MVVNTTFKNEAKLIPILLITKYIATLFLILFPKSMHFFRDTSLQYFVYIFRLFNTCTMKY